jgi:hypothetical protein
MTSLSATKNQQAYIKRLKDKGICIRCRLRKSRERYLFCEKCRKRQNKNYKKYYKNKPILKWKKNPLIKKN